jgi:hypothetical protein
MLSRVLQGEFLRVLKSPLRFRPANVAFVFLPFAFNACETVRHVPAEGPTAAVQAAAALKSPRARTSKQRLASVSNVASVIKAGETSSFVITLSKANSTSPTNINYQLTGSALLGLDYNVASQSTFLTIPAGARSTTLGVTALDSGATLSKTATMVLRSGAGYKVSNTAAQNKITIQAAPTPTATPIPTPSPIPQPEVWIAVRTDGLPGTGTQADPYDGSTAEKFDEAMLRLPWTGLNIHLIGSGPFRSDLRHNWHLHSGWTLSGDGMDVTVVQMVGNLGGVTGGASLLSSDPNYTTDNVTIRDLTVDCNWPELSATADDGAGGEKNAKIGAVVLWGSNNLVQRVRSINSYGSWANLKEQFAIMLIAPRTGDGTNNVIDSCRAELPRGNYGNPFALAGWVDSSPKHIQISSKVISCTAIGVNDGNNSGFTSGGVNLGNVKNCVIDGNTFIDCNGAAYTDTGTVDGLTVSNNHVVRGWLGVGIHSSALPKQNIVVTGNDFLIQNRYSNGASYGVSVDYGPTTNVTIDGNTFNFEASGNGQREFLAVEGAHLTNTTISNNVIGSAACPVYNRVTGTGLNMFNNHAPDGSRVNGL